MTGFPNQPITTVLRRIGSVGGTRAAGTRRKQSCPAGECNENDCHPNDSRASVAIMLDFIVSLVLTIVATGALL